MLAAAAAAAPGDDPEALTRGRRLVAEGASTGAPACGNCHGAAAEGQEDAPRLAGLDAGYLRDQLVAYANGTRENASMAKIAKAMDSRSIADAAAYFAHLPVSAASSAAAPTSANPQATAGAVLALRGDWAHNLPPCALCHGADSGGVGAAFPSIVDQPAAYTTGQLRAWKAGTRHDDPQGLMRVIAARMSDEQIAAAAAYYATSARTTELPPKPATSSNGLSEMVELGEAIFRDPAAHAGAYVGNALTCENCHVDAGRRADSGPMGAAWVAYPAFRKKNGHVNTFAERLQGCFAYSMNGRPPPLDDRVLLALESYAFSLAKGAPTGIDLPGRGYPKLAPPQQGIDLARGAAIFKVRCAICHGADGLGQEAAGRTVFPPLWGPASFNWGAGMSSIENAAGFIKANMPLGQGYSLSDQDAWDVATFVDSHERPQDPRFTGDVATTRKRFHDEPTSMYGARVNGAVLGEAAPPAGPPAQTH